MAQLVAWLLPSPEVSGANPYVGRSIVYLFTNFTAFLEKTKIQDKVARIGPFFK